MEAAVRRLVGAGLVSVADGWFRITAGRASSCGAPGPAAGVATTVDTVQGVLTRRHAPGSADWILRRGGPRGRRAGVRGPFDPGADAAPLAAEHGR